MAYKKVGWKDYPSTDTPINATNLDHMDAGILENAQTIGDKTKISGIGDGTVAGAIAANKSAIDANAEAIAQNTQSLTNKNRATTICRLNTTIYDEDSQDLYMEFTCEQNPNDFNLFTAIVSGAYIQTPVYIPEWYSETENCINISASRTVPADKHYIIISTQ